MCCRYTKCATAIQLPLYKMCTRKLHPTFEIRLLNLSRRYYLISTSTPIDNLGKLFVHHIQKVLFRVEYPMP